MCRGRCRSGGRGSLNALLKRGVGCCGLTAADGLTAHDLDDAAVKRAAIASARRVIAVTEAGKLSRTALAFVAPVTALDAVITDDSASEEETGALTAAGVTVRTV